MWPIPSAFLTGTSAAAGIAAINSLGNLSGFAGPYMMGYLKDATGNFTAGLLVLGGCALVGGIAMDRRAVRVQQSEGATCGRMVRLRGVGGARSERERDGEGERAMR